MLGLDQQRPRDELPVADIYHVERVDVFLQEGAVLADGPVTAGGHLRHPDVFPVGDVVGFYVFQEHPDVREQI